MHFLHNACAIPVHVVARLHVVRHLSCTVMHFLHNACAVPVHGPGSYTTNNATAALHTFCVLLMEPLPVYCSIDAEMHSSGQSFWPISTWIFPYLSESEQFRIFPNILIFLNMGRDGREWGFGQFGAMGVGQRFAVPSISIFLPLCIQLCLGTWMSSLLSNLSWQHKQTSQRKGLMHIPNDSILRTTSIPPTTRPKTTCLPSWQTARRKVQSTKARRRRKEDITAD